MEDSQIIALFLSGPSRRSIICLTSMEKSV